MYGVQPGEVGSPPRMRGKLDRPRLLNAETRDHPRGCGENPTRCRARLRRLGSPPRMRGKLVRAVSSITIRRITPADAGKTGERKNFANSGQDHPRGCGENWLIKVDDCVNTGITPADAGKTGRYALKLSKCLGSPPRMRGKPCGNGGEKPTGRITPADAGKTTKGASVLMRRRDHPRGCGENGEQDEGQSA